MLKCHHGIFGQSKVWPEPNYRVLITTEALAKRLRVAGCIYTTMRSQVALGGVTDLVGDLWVEFSAGAHFRARLGHSAPISRYLGRRRAVFLARDVGGYVTRRMIWVAAMTITPNIR